MSDEATFISGDGVEHRVRRDSVAFEMMSKDGAFKRLYSDEEALALLADTPPESKDDQIVNDENPSGAQTDEDKSVKPRSKRPKLELLAEAEAMGLTLVPDEVTKKQIIAAMEAHEAAANTDSSLTNDAA